MDRERKREGRGESGNAGNVPVVKCASVGAVNGNTDRANYPCGLWQLLYEDNTLCYHT